MQHTQIQKPKGKYKGAKKSNLKKKKKKAEFESACRKI